MTQSKTGFTILEVLVAITVTSIVVTGLYTAFSFSQKAVGAVDESLLALQESRVTLDTLKRELEAVFYSQDKTYSFLKISDRDYYGRQSSDVSFTAFSPLIPGLSRIGYSIVKEGEKLSLRKKITSAYSLSGDNRGIDMIEDLDSFTVEAKYNDNWVKTWDSSLIKDIPDEVRITIVVITGDRRERITMSDIARPRSGKPI